MFARNRIVILLTPALLSVALTGCLGGSVAQQLAQSLVIHGADKITSDAYEAKLRNENEARRNVVLKDTVPDEYWAAFITSGFSTITPTVEPIPTQASTETKPAPLQANRLVRVEMWNLLVGEEKRSVLEKSRSLGASLPPPNEWKRWQVAIGALHDNKTDDDKSKPITFLIPPDFGRISSGDDAFVELAGTGDLSIARYPAR